MIHLEVYFQYFGLLMQLAHLLLQYGKFGKSKMANCHVTEEADSHDLVTRKVCPGFFDESKYVLVTI